MGNKRHKNQQGIRLPSACKIGVNFPGSILVKKCVALRTFCGNQGACGMFSGSPNCFNSLEVIPFVMRFFNILTGFSPLNKAVRMMVMATETFFLPWTVIFPKVIFRKRTLLRIPVSAQLFVGFIAGYLTNTNSSFLNFINRLRMLSESWCDNGACRRSLRNRLRISFLPERYSSGVNVVC